MFHIYKLYYWNNNNNLLPKSVGLLFFFFCPESEAGQKDIGYLSECVLHYLRELPSPVIPACIYPHLQTVATLQQQGLQQSAGTLALTLDVC